MKSKKTIGAVISHDIELFDSHPEVMILNIDDHLSDLTALAMKEKLSIARSKGRGGWWMDDCTIEKLKSMLAECIAKGDMIDVINIAAMIYAKEAIQEAREGSGNE